MISVNLKFPGERLAQFTISYGANPMSQYRIVGTEGDLEVSPGFTWQQGLTHTLTVGEKKTTKTYGKSDHFGGETKYFSDCVLDDKHPEPDGEEGLADVRVIKAIEESLKTGQPVTLPPGPVRTQRPTREQIVKLGAVSPGKMRRPGKPLCDKQPVFHDEWPVVRRPLRTFCLCGSIPLARGSAGCGSRNSPSPNACWPGPARSL